MERLPLVPIPEGLRCAVCGPEHQHPLGVRWYLAGDRVEGEWVANERGEGWPGMLHGMAFAGLHDDAAAWAMIALEGQTGFTTRMEVQFARPIRIGQEVRILGRPAQVGPRGGAFATEILLPGGEVASTARTEFAFVDEATLQRLLGAKELSPDLARWMRAPVPERKRLVVERGRAHLAR